jgi:hypothetical protein
MAQVYGCPFGCDMEHRDTLASEAQAYWYGIHWAECPSVEREANV